MKFTKAQKRTLAACVLLYATAYLNRLNLSAALGDVTDALNLTSASAGMTQTCFAVVYAAGQFVNGMLADRFNPIRYMMLGMIGTAACNIALGAAGSYPVILALCMVNGAFQSMLWTPIVRMMALHFTEKSVRQKANLLLNSSLIVGHLGAWAIAGGLSSLLDWRYAFIAPACVAVPAIFVALHLFGKQTATIGREDARSSGDAGDGALRVLMKTGFPFILIACVMFGFIKDGIMTWTPSILRGLSDGDSLSSTTVSLIIPLINLLGMTISYYLLKKTHFNNRNMIACLMCACSLLSAPLGRVGGMALPAVFIGCVSACIYGVSPVLTVLVPLEYERAGKVGMTAGLIDSSIYVGSAIAGVAGGGVIDALGVNALYLSWGAAALIAAVTAFLSGGMARKNAARLSET